MRPRVVNLEAARQARQERRERQAPDDDSVAAAMAQVGVWTDAALTGWCTAVRLGGQGPWIVVDYGLADAELARIVLSNRLGLHATTGEERQQAAAYHTALMSDPTLGAQPLPLDVLPMGPNHWCYRRGET